MKRPNKVVLVNYANAYYASSQKKNTKTGREIARFDDVFEYTPKDIERDFFMNNKKILSEFKGNGYWLWKPYLIRKAMNRISFDDYLFYSDAGCYFIESIDYLFASITDMEELVVFDLYELLEKHFTKRDTFILMNLDEKEYYDTFQILASFCLWKKTSFTLKFLDEWLQYCQDERLLTDIENTCGQPNYDGFRGHRWDQSVFSLLCKKYKIVPYRDPSNWGVLRKEKYQNSYYPQLIIHDHGKKFIKDRIKKRAASLFDKILSKFKNRQRHEPN